MTDTPLEWEACDSLDYASRHTAGAVMGDVAPLLPPGYAEDATPEMVMAAWMHIMALQDNWIRTERVRLTRDSALRLLAYAIVESIDEYRKTAPMIAAMAEAAGRRTWCAFMDALGGEGGSM